MKKCILVIMKLPIILLIATSLLACTHHSPNKKKSSDLDFDFSYNDVFYSCFSLKVSSMDTIYLTQHFASKRHPLKSQTNYYATLSKQQQQEIMDTLWQVDFSVYDTTYYENYEDGSAYAFNIRTPTLEKCIYVHSLHPPIRLEALTQFLLAFTENLVLHPTSVGKDYRTEKYVRLPRFKVDSVKFLPPNNNGEKTPN